MYAYPCRSALIVCESPSDLPLWTPIESNARFGRCVVKKVDPEPCFLRTGEEAKVVQAQRPKPIAESENYVVYDSKQGPVVYPKSLMAKIERLIVTPTIETGAPASNGLLLVGPPGTGKTTLAELLANILGAYFKVVMPSDYLSKWLGESEQRLRKIFEEVRENAPAVLVLDDFESLGSSRALSGARSTVDVVYNLQAELFRFLDVVSKNSEPVVVVANTNMNPDELDAALKRGQRLGKPHVLPPPSAEGYQLWLEAALKLGRPKWLLATVSKVGEDPVRRFLAKAASWGASPADVMEALKSWGDREPEIPRTGPGYALLGVSGTPVRNGLTECVAKILSQVRGKVLAVWRTYDVSAETLSEQAPLIKALVAVGMAIAGKTAVVPLSPEKLGDALTMAKYGGFAAVVPSLDVVPGPSQWASVMSAEAPAIILVAPPEKIKELPRVQLYECYRKSAKRELIEAVAAYLGIPVGNESAVPDDPVRLARAVAYAENVNASSLSEAVISAVP